MPARALTIAAMHTIASKQEIFDIVARHLIAQGAPSMNKAGDMCSYRGAEGRMCAIGVLIPDALYDAAMETYPASTVCGTRFPKLSHLLLGVEDGNFLNHLQSAHDNADGDPGPSWTDDVKSRLRDVAKMFDLDATSAM